MTPKNRERAYERRRYEEWQARQASRQARVARRRQAGIVGTALLVVVLIGVVFLVLTNNDDDSGSQAAVQPSASPSAGTSPSASPVTSTCPPAEGGAQESPPQYAQAPDPKNAEGKTWTWAVETSCGSITVELDGKAAPQAVASTLFLSTTGFYNNTPCHRLTTEGIFVLQCGDPTGSGSGGPGYSYGPVENAPEGDVYPAGTIAMARQGGKADSMGSQFFLVYKESTIPSDAAGGYTVLGRITKGLDVVEKVAEGGVSGGGSDGAPVSAVTITSTKASAD